MSPALLSSLLKTLGIEPQVIAAHVAAIAQAAQAHDARLIALEARLARIETILVAQGCVAARQDHGESGAPGDAQRLIAAPDERNTDE